MNLWIHELKLLVHLWINLREEVPYAQAALQICDLNSLLIEF